MILEDFKLGKKDVLPLIIISIVSLLTTLKLIEFHMSGGIFFPDKALYLITSLLYADMDVYNIVNPNDLFFSPIILYLTSIFFRMGINEQLSISLVTSIFGVLSYFGMYILLKNKFSPLLSLTGVIIFGSFSEVLLNLASGLIDLPSVSITIWIIIFSIIAIDKNQKYFIFVFSLFVIGFFTRYTVGFSLPVIVLYYFIRRNLINNIDLIICGKESFREKFLNYIHSAEFKYIILSVIFAGILFFIICKFLILDYGGSLIFFEQSADTFNGNQIGFEGLNVVYDKLFYLKNFSLMLFHEARPLDFTQSCILYTILLIGFLCSLIMSFNKIKEFFLQDFKRIYFTENLSKILIILSFVLLIIMFIGFKVFSNHMIANICLLSLLIIFFSLTKKFSADEKNHALDILFIAYFLIYLIFISVYPMKVTRYALPLIPPFIYFIIWSLDNILKYIKSKSNNGHKSRIVNVIPIAIIIIFLISTFLFITPLEIEKKPVDTIDHFINYRGSPNDLVDITQYIIDNDENYHSKTYASYYHHHRMIKWYLKEDVDFINDDYRLIDENTVDYVIINDKVTFKNYHNIYHCGDFYLYQHN